MPALDPEATRARSAGEGHPTPPVPPVPPSPYPLPKGEGNNDGPALITLPRGAENHKGSALIITLGVLALISLLAFTFVSLARSERHISQNYVDQVRATILARSGAEQAIARLRATTLVKAWDDPRDPWVYHANTNTGVGAGQPLATAREVEDETGCRLRARFRDLRGITAARGGRSV